MINQQQDFQQDLSKDNELNRNCQNILDNLHDKIILIYRHWVANAILNDPHGQSFDHLKKQCQEICFEYLKYKISNFETDKYLELVINYIDNMIDNLVNQQSES